MKINVPPEIFGGNPAGLMDRLGLHVDRAPSSSDELWEVSANPTDLIDAKTLHGPGLKRSRFDLCTPPTPNVPGGGCQLTW